MSKHNDKCEDCDVRKKKDGVGPWGVAGLRVPGQPGRT